MSYFTYHDRKQIFYKETGNSEGEPCIFLHGNTASSRMFEFILPLYQEEMKAVLMDFLGNGKSDRVSSFPEELWIDQGHQIVGLCRALGCDKVNLIGTSGGAYAAINAALEAPELFRKVVADSFDGSTLPEGFGEGIIRERTAAKKDEQARGFYEWCQGEDWEKVVDLNTQALITCAVNKTPLFCKSLESLDTPILFMGSLEDDMCRQDMLEEYKEMDRLVGNGKIYMFETGGHPAVLSNAESAARVITDFLNGQSLN